MKECCANCKYKLSGIKFDFAKVGESKWQTFMDGFICVALASEGDAVWMLGLDQDSEICEMYTPRSEK